MVPVSYPPSRIVETSYGKVQGRRLVHEGEQQVDAFQGIPFAAPPLEDLRFRKPIPPAHWEGILQTTAFAPRSIQLPKSPQDYATNGVPSEDCLYLNVFTPCWDPPQGGFPVMMYIHGGLYMIGEASTVGDVGISENIVSRGIVFVTIHYRLGYLGFLSTGDTACPGNFGLWDQVEALKWIHLNIRAFGGNKDNITVIGHSAGAACVDFLHLSPHSTNLFHKAICMAGSADCRWAMHPDMKAQTRDKAKRLGIEDCADSEELLAKLRQFPAMDFGTSVIVQVKEDHMDSEVGPCLDGDFFPESLDALRAKATPKPFIAGVTQEEGLVAALRRGPGFNKPEGLEQVLKDVTVDCRRKEEMKVELRKQYIGNKDPTSEEGVRALVELLSDAIFVAGIPELCRKTIVLQKEPVFLYVFEHYNAAIMGPLGAMMPFQSATHSCELFYLFKKGLIADPPMTETEMRVIDTFTKALTNFAKYGDPNGKYDIANLPVHWDQCSKDSHSRNFVITSEGAEMKEQLFEGRTETFLEIYKKCKL